MTFPRLSVHLCLVISLSLSLRQDAMFFPSFPPCGLSSGSDPHPLYLEDCRGKSVLQECLRTSQAQAGSYAFLLFQEESSVQALIDSCIEEDGKLYLCVSSPTIKDKPCGKPSYASVLVCSVELAMIMDRLYGGVCYAGIDTDPELKYPKGAGRVAFSNQQSYIAAISARFVQLQHNDIDKRVEVKPYVLDDQMCDECQGARCGGKFAPFFCANVTCLQYYCEFCWASIHSRAGRDFHKPLVKEGGDRPRHVSFRWS
ncbi:hypothetical protein DNTS_029137 [Danionella cerebrum]|uniref:Cytoplasmic polyadenylation element-binding protein ZZ domain-containing protein n=1 Tax=Danionella cerebrum TaxID=2873325 RepID=A0A553MRT6_9TELE|nr:hypothetical protein DNTS_029137 [Danionella translucida]